MKRSALVGVKLAVSAALLIYLFSITDTHALEHRVRAADLLALGAAICCYAAMMGLATWRWQLLLETLGLMAPPPAAARARMKAALAALEASKVQPRSEISVALNERPSK